MKILPREQFDLLTMQCDCNRYFETSKDSLLLFDKAYHYYRYFADWTEEGVCFACRLKDNADSACRRQCAQIHPEQLIQPIFEPPTGSLSGIFFVIFLISLILFPSICVNHVKKQKECFSNVNYVIRCDDRSDFIFLMYNLI